MNLDKETRLELLRMELNIKKKLLKYKNKKKKAGK